MGDVAASEMMFRRSLDINPKSQHAHINLIVFYIERGNFLNN